MSEEAAHGNARKSPLMETKTKCSRTRRNLTIAEKMKVLRDVELGRRHGDLAIKYGIPRSSLQTIVKNKQKILELYKYDILPVTRIRFRPNKNCELERKLLRYMSHHKNKNIILTGSAIQEKALVIAAQMNIAGFKASNGWLNRFKKRYACYNYQLHESDSENCEDPLEFEDLDEVSNFNDSSVKISDSDSNDDDDDDDKRDTVIVVVKGEDSNPNEGKLDNVVASKNIQSDANSKLVLEAIKVIQDHLSKTPNMPLHVTSCFSVVSQYINESYDQSSSKKQ